MNNNGTEITLKGIENPILQISDDAVAYAGQCIAAAALINRVEDANQQNHSVACLTDVKSLIKRIDKAREHAKRPVIELGRLIDRKAKEFTDPLEEQAGRVSRLISGFQCLEMERVEKLKREEEARRRKALEEESKKQAELNAKLEKAKSDERRSSLMAQKQEAEQKLTEVIIDSVSMENKTAPVRVSGMIVRKEWKFEVTDINALFKAKPECIIFEPNNMVIRSLVKHGLHECPGLRIWEEVSTGVRT